MIRIFILLMLAIPYVRADTSEDLAIAAMDNISGEYALCAAYFAIVSQAVATNTKGTETSEQYKSMYTTAMQASIAAAKATRNDDMALKVTLSRYYVYLAGMKDEIENNYSNISILLNKHSYTCKDAIEKPDKFINTINEKTNRNHTK